MSLDIEARENSVARVGRAMSIVGGNGSGKVTVVGDIRPSPKCCQHAGKPTHEEFGQVNFVAVGLPAD